MEKEKQQKKEKSSNIDALYMIVLVLAIFIFIGLVTKDALFGEFGSMFSDMIMGVFGFISYGVFPLIAVFSVIKIFSKARMDIVLFFSAAMIFMGGTFIFHMLTSDGAGVFNGSLSISEYVDKSYSLEEKGLAGASAGGALTSLILFYLIKAVGLTGVYIVSSTLLIVGGLGIFSAVRKLEVFDKGDNYNQQRQRKFTPASNKRQKQQRYEEHEEYEEREEYEEYEEAPVVQQAPSISYNALGLKIKNKVDTSSNTTNQGNNERRDDNSRRKVPFKKVPINTVKKKLHIVNLQGSTTEKNVTKRGKKPIAKGVLFEGDNVQQNIYNDYNLVRNLGEDKIRNENVPRKSYFENPADNKYQQVFGQAGKSRDGIHILPKDIEVENSSDFTVFDKENKKTEYIPIPQNMPKPVQKKVLTESAMYDLAAFGSALPKKRPKILTLADLKDFKSTPEKVEVVTEEKKVASKEDIFSVKPSIDLEHIRKTFNNEKSNKSTKRGDIITSLSQINEKAPQKEVEQENVANSVKEKSVQYSSLNRSGYNYDPSKDSFVDYEPEPIKQYNSSNDRNESQEIYDFQDPRDNNFENQKYFSSNFKEKDDLVKKEDLVEKNEYIQKIDLVKNDFIIKQKNEEIDELEEFMDNKESLEDSLNCPGDFIEAIEEETINPSSENSIGFYSRKNTENTYEKDIVDLNVDKDPKVTVTIPDIRAVQEIQIENNVQKKPYKFPPFELLDIVEKENELCMEEVEEKARLLENVLDDFKIPCKVVEIVVGPTVTKFELEIPQGVQVKRIEGCSKEITLWLKSPSEVIIQAPIPGKNRLGVEVPNEVKEIVSLREVISSDDFINAKSKTLFALGKDVAGKNILCDIKDMPHLLVAGATGMGKSVCLNSLIMSLLYHADPADVRLLLIDPKKVEFIAYKGIPHLLIDEIISENDKALLAFQWAIDEMEKRYIMFQSIRQKELEGYNAIISAKGGTKLPRIVIVVDEVADLMSVNKKEVEAKIQRLTQKARAAGIHLVLATQRPSVDVITGIIKTNLPSRIAFKLSNGIDSKTVIDEVGAERLLGRGDMFYKPGTWPAKTRTQGCYVSVEEVDRVVDFVVAHNEPQFDQNCYDAIFNQSTKSSFGYGNNDGTVDEYFKDVVRLAIETGTMSTTLIQRRFGVGYPRAGKLIDNLERAGYISPPMKNRGREVLLDSEGFEREFGELI